MKAKLSTGDSFAFTAENAEWVKGQLAKYPANRSQSAVMPLLHRAQAQNGGWLSMAAIEYIADVLGMARIRVLEVATFYTMYNLTPVGKHVIEVCTTTPCWLRDSDAVVSACREELGIGFGETTDDGLFTLLEVECLGACVNAPVVSIHHTFYEDLTADSMKAIIRDLKAGKALKAGPQIDRQTSAPAGMTQAAFAGDA